MITKRIIPCLDVRNGRVVKGVNFQGLQDVDSPVALGKYYSDSGADELVFYDITASYEDRALFTDILSALYVLITIFIILAKHREIFRIFDDFWQRYLPAKKRGENPEYVSFDCSDES